MRSECATLGIVHSNPIQDGKYEIAHVGSNFITVCSSPDNSNSPSFLLIPTSAITSYPPTTAYHFPFTHVDRIISHLLLGFVLNCTNVTAVGGSLPRHPSLNPIPLIKPCAAYSDLRSSLIKSQDIIRKKKGWSWVVIQINEKQILNGGNFLLLWRSSFHGVLCWYTCFGNTGACMRFLVKSLR